MRDRVFIDTNIIVYLYSVNEPVKMETAKMLVAENNSVISTQVLQEFTNTLRKKYKAEWTEILSALKEIKNAASVSINTPETNDKAISIAEKYRYSFYDSLIIAAALEANCKILYSEDMQHKQVILGKLSIINPFI